ncbi:MAG: hypothetical protein HYX69_03760 [Planctomycetia bacterium]|nr:hypothetical protein [Planctomycetia bacterium]
MGARLSLTHCFVAALLVASAAGCAGSAGDPSSTPAEVAAAQQAPRLELALDTSGAATSVDVLGLAPEDLAAFQKLNQEQRSAAVRVVVAGSGAADVPAVLGDVAVVGDALRFTPRYPLGRGLRYGLVVARDQPAPDTVATSGGVSLEFTTPAQPQTAVTNVEHVYPSAARLPENQLKFYIHFSGPMARGDAYRHVHLLGADGRELEAVFLELGQELWDPSMRRFTLLLDPGRIKRGLVPREELGPVLEAGKDYTLVVDRDWPDAAGQKLAGDVRKAFHVLPVDEAPIDPAAWAIEAPMAGGRGPLVVRFPEPLDHSLLERVVWVADGDGERIAGAIAIGDDETRWQFTPGEPWLAGDYRLVAEAALEDLAGNAIGRAFDVDTFGPVSKHIETDTVSIPFSVTPAE